MFSEPEERLVGTPSDIWAVGCLLLEVLVDESAFEDPKLYHKPFERRLESIREKQRQWVCCLAGSMLLGYWTSVHTIAS